MYYFHATHLGDVLGVAVGVSQFAAEERGVLVLVDGVGQRGLPLVRVRFEHDELAHRVAREDVFQHVERKTEHLRG